MAAFLTAGETLPFTGALVLMLLIGVVQAVGFTGADIDADADVEGGPAAMLDWVNAGRLPLLMLLVLFLFVFGALGLTLQRFWFEAAGGLLSPWIATPVALAASLPLTRWLGRGVARVLPGDETAAVERESLVGRVALVVTGAASAGSPAQARLRDAHGQRHYLMLEPADPEERFAEGESVLIVRREGATFYGVRNDEPALQHVRT